MGHLKELRALGLSNNRINGSDPRRVVYFAEFISFRNCRIMAFQVRYLLKSREAVSFTSLDLSNNRLSGALPPELCELVQLELLEFEE